MEEVGVILLIAFLDSVIVIIFNFSYCFYFYRSLFFSSIFLVTTISLFVYLFFFFLPLPTFLKIFFFQEGQLLHFFLSFFWSHVKSIDCLISISEITVVAIFFIFFSQGYNCLGRLVRHKQQDENYSPHPMYLEHIVLASLILLFIKQFIASPISIKGLMITGHNIRFNIITTNCPQFCYSLLQEENSIITERSIFLLS